MIILSRRCFNFCDVNVDSKTPLPKMKSNKIRIYQEIFEVLKPTFRSTRLVQASDWSPRVQFLSMRHPLPLCLSPCQALSTPALSRSLTSWQGRGKRWQRRMTTCHSWTRSPAASQLRRPPNVQVNWTSPAEVELLRGVRGACSFRWRRFSLRRLHPTPLDPFLSHPVVLF